jgi:hypothetical protein
MQSEDTLSKYGQSFQTKVVAALLSDGNMLDILGDVINKKFFESEANKWIVDEVMNYHAEYHKVPSIDVFKVEVSKIDNPALQKTIVAQLKEVYQSIGNLDLQYIKDEFTAFCINQNLKNVIVQSIDLLKSGNYDKIKELVDRAMKVGVDADLGMDYLTDF